VSDLDILPGGKTIVANLDCGESHFRRMK
jgi:hypothetical protein